MFVISKVMILILALIFFYGHESMALNSKTVKKNYSAKIGTVWNRIGKRFKIKQQQQQQEESQMSNLEHFFSVNNDYWDHLMKDK